MALDSGENQPIPGKLYGPNQIMLCHISNDGGRIFFHAVDGANMVCGEHDVTEDDVYMYIGRGVKGYIKGGSPHPGYIFLCGDRRIHVDDYEIDLVQERKQGQWQKLT